MLVNAHDIKMSSMREQTARFSLYGVCVCIETLCIMREKNICHKFWFASTRRMFVYIRQKGSFHTICLMNALDLIYIRQARQNKQTELLIFGVCVCISTSCIKRHENICHTTHVCAHVSAKTFFHTKCLITAHDLKMSSTRKQTHRFSLFSLCECI